MFLSKQVKTQNAFQFEDYIVTQVANSTRYKSVSNDFHSYWGGISIHQQVLCKQEIISIFKVFPQDYFIINFFQQPPKVLIHILSRNYLGRMYVRCTNRLFFLVFQQKKSPLKLSYLPWYLSLNEKYNISMAPIGIYTHAIL